MGAPRAKPPAPKPAPEAPPPPTGRGWAMSHNPLKRLWAWVSNKFG